MCLLLAVFLLTFAACNNDDGTQPGQAIIAPAVEVCIVFAPNELGDRGYADRLLTGMYQFYSQLGEQDRERVQLRYISVSDTNAVHNELRHWDRQAVSPYTRKSYERRLLVLSDPVLLPMLEDAPLDSTDEVLVTNVSNKYFGQTPHADELGGRLHLLSISAAEAARKFCRMVEHAETPAPETHRQVWLLEQFSDRQVSADSIGTVFSDYAANAQGFSLYSYAKHNAYGSINTLSEAYTQAHYLPLNVVEEEFICFPVCCWGNLNVALSSLIVAKGMYGIQATFLDTDYIAIRGICHTIVRHYDRALAEWLVRWLNAPAATMPAREWHGAWDGYVTDDIQTYD